MKPSLVIRDEDISMVEHSKYLGVHEDQYLSWDVHYIKISKDIKGVRYDTPCETVTPFKHTGRLAPSLFRDISALGNIVTSAGACLAYWRPCTGVWLSLISFSVAPFGVFVALQHSTSFRSSKIVQLKC